MSGNTFALDFSNILKIFFAYSGVFNEHTIRGLRFYDEAGWKNTAAFMEKILNMWKVLNVKSTSKGRHDGTVVLNINCSVAIDAYIINNRL